MNIIKKARALLGMTQAQLARRLKVTSQTVRNWENGEPSGSAEAYCESVVAWNEYQKAALDWQQAPTATAQERVDRARERFLRAMGVDNG